MNPLVYHPLAGLTEADRLAAKFWCFDGPGGDAPSGDATTTDSTSAPAHGVTDTTDPTPSAQVDPTAPTGPPGRGDDGLGGTGPSAPSAPSADVGRGVMGMVQGQVNPTSVFDTVMGLALSLAPGIGIGKGISSLATALGLEGKADFSSLGDAPVGGSATAPGAPSTAAPGGGPADTAVTVPGAAIASPSAVSGTGGGASVGGGAAPSSVAGGTGGGFSDTVRRNLMLAMLGQGRVNG